MPVVRGAGLTSAAVLIALCIACSAGDKDGDFDAAATQDAAVPGDGPQAADAALLDVNPRDYTFVPCSHDDPCPAPFECVFFEHTPPGAYMCYPPCVGGDCGGDDTGCYCEGVEVGSNYTPDHHCTCIQGWRAADRGALPSACQERAGAPRWLSDP